MTQLLTKQSGAEVTILKFEISTDIGNKLMGWGGEGEGGEGDNSATLATAPALGLLTSDVAD